MIEHGGDVYTPATRLALDFSSNISPLGMPTPVWQAVMDSACLWEKYPDPHCRQLCGAIAQAHGVPEDWVLCGNGAADLIYRLCLALPSGRALVTAPSFLEYEAALQLAGWHTVRHVLLEEEGFKVTRRIVKEIVPGIGLVFLCTPNNPTGVPVEGGLLHSIVRQCMRVGAVLAVDECFLDFVEGGDSCIPLLGGRLVVLKAFTKLYAMAGLRLGYALCGDGALLHAMKEAGPPWAVSAPAQAAGIAALGVADWPSQVRQVVSRERQWLKEQLAPMGLHPMGEANYLLFSAPLGLKQKMLSRGILIRDCAQYPGLGEGWYRVAVRRHEDNIRLVAALKEVLHG